MKDRCWEGYYPRLLPGLLSASPVSAKGSALLGCRFLPGWCSAQAYGTKQWPAEPSETMNLNKVLLYVVCVGCFGQLEGKCQWPSWSVQGAFEYFFPVSTTQRLWQGLVAQPRKAPRDGTWTGSWASLFFSPFHVDSSFSSLRGKYPSMASSWLPGPREWMKPCLRKRWPSDSSPWRAG